MSALGDLDLTTEEEAELKRCPIGELPKSGQFSPAELEIRRSVAKKMEDALLAAQDIHPTLQVIYAKMPMHKFYREKQNPSLLRRVFGVCLGADQQERVHSGSSSAGYFGRIHCAIDGVPIDELEEVVDDWTDADKQSIMLLSAPAVFLDPCGYMLLF